MLTEAYEMGRGQGFDNDCICSYPYGTKECEEWHRGFADAREELGNWEKKYPVRRADGRTVFCTIPE